MSTERHLKRRSFLGAGGVATAAALGAGAFSLSAPAAHADGLQVVENEVNGRLHYYRFSTPSVAWNPGVNVLVPDNYDPNKRYPVLYALHGGGGDFREFHMNHGIVEKTVGRELIVVMPDGGPIGWYCNPVSSNVGPRNWETFHMSELIPWVDANYPTHAEYAGRAVTGFSMGGFGALKYTAKYYGHFASVSSHSGPASLRRDFQIVAQYINQTSKITLAGGSIYGDPWNEDLVSADNPVENIESYRNKRIFMVAGTDRAVGAPNLDTGFWNLQEEIIRNGQAEFGDLLNQAGINHTRYEEPGGHFVRGDRLQEDIDGIVEHLKRAG